MDLAAWDQESVSKNGAELKKLYQKMLQALEKAPQEVEVLWRLARLAHLLSLSTASEDEMKAYSIESYQHAAKAVALKGDHFESNVWLAYSAGKLYLIEPDKRAIYIPLFLRHLDICKQQKPEEYMVLFMEGRLQSILVGLDQEEKQLLKAIVEKEGLAMPVLNLEVAETKLRKAIALQGDSFEAYSTLAFVLGSQVNKFREAIEAIDKSLQLVRQSSFDSYEKVARRLEKMKAKIVAKSNEPNKTNVPK